MNESFINGYEKALEDAVSALEHLKRIYEAARIFEGASYIKIAITEIRNLDDDLSS